MLFWHITQADEIGIGPTRADDDGQTITADLTNVHGADLIQVIEPWVLVTFPLFGAGDLCCFDDGRVDILCGLPLLLCYQFAVPGREGEEGDLGGLHLHRLDVIWDGECLAAALHAVSDEGAEFEHVLGPCLAVHLLEVFGDVVCLEDAGLDVGADSNSRLREGMLLVQTHDLQVRVLIAFVLLNHAVVAAVLHVKEAVFAADLEVRDRKNRRRCLVHAGAHGTDFVLRRAADE